jgi:rod shape-determining protein MreC
LPVLREPGARYAPPRASALGLRALVLVGMSVALMVVDHRQQQLFAIRAALSAAAYPLQLLVHSPVAAWDWLTASFATRHTLLEENAGLRAAVRAADARLLRLDATEQENLRLRALLNAAPHAATRVQLAEILHVDLDAVRHRVLVDRGTRDGVTRGQAAVDGSGVFGQVANAGTFASELILISDSTHAVPVQVERNGLRTIAVGTGNTRRLSLPFLPRNADVALGDVLVTSGLGGVYPPGLPVGRISELRRDPSQPLAIVTAEPAAALDRDREVLLVWYQPRVPANADVGPAQPPPRAEAAARQRTRTTRP